MNCCNSKQYLHLFYVLFIFLIFLPLPANATILWTSDFNSGSLSDKWNTITCNGATQNQQTFVTSPVREGARALRQDVNTTCGASDTYGGRAGLQQIFKGDDAFPFIDTADQPTVYFGWSLYLPNMSMTSSEWIIHISAQTMWTNENRPPYGVEFTYENDLARRGSFLKWSNGTEGDEFHTIVNSSYFNTWLYSTTEGVWHDFMVGQKFANDTTGWTQVYHKLSNMSDWTLIVNKSGYRTDYTNYSDTVYNRAFYIQGSFYRGGGSVPYANQTLYKDNFVLGNESFEEIAVYFTEGADAPVPGAPNITSWSNTKTSDSDLEFPLYVNQNIKLNVTANQTITNWTWKKDGVIQSNNYDNITVVYTTSGSHTLSVSATNTNGTSSTILWNSTVTQANTWNWFGNIRYDIPWDDNWNSNTSKDNIAENRGSHNLGLGRFADNFEDNTELWSNYSGKSSMNISTTQARGIYSFMANLTNQSESYSYQSLLSSWSAPHTVVVWVYDNGSGNDNTFHVGVGNSSDYFMGVSTSSTAQVCPTGGNSTHYCYRINSNRYNSSVARATGWTPFKYIFNGTYMNGYINDNLVFSVAETTGSNAVVVGNLWSSSGISYYDDVLVYESESGNFTSTHNWTDGNVTGSIIANITTPDNTNYSIYYRESGIGDYSLLASNQSGNGTFNITTKYQNTDARVQLFGNGTVSPEIEKLTLQGEEPEAPPITEYMPPTPTNLSQTNGSSWVNYTWEAGSGNVTDSYNVSLINNSVQYWINGSSQNWTNSTLAAGQWSNITVYAFNNSGSGSMNATGISMNTQTAATPAVPASAQSQYKTNTCQSTLGWGETGSALLKVLIMVMVGGLAIGFLTGKINFDTFPIIEVTFTLIAVVVVGLIGVAFIDPVIIAVGCP